MGRIFFRTSAIPFTVLLSSFGMTRCVTKEGLEQKQTGHHTLKRWIPLHPLKACDSSIFPLGRSSIYFVTVLDECILRGLNLDLIIFWVGLDH